MADRDLPINQGIVILCELEESERSPVDQIAKDSTPDITVRKTNQSRLVEEKHRFLNPATFDGDAGISIYLLPTCLKSIE